MSSYAGRHAELYDLFYADKPYRGEAEFIDGLIQKFGKGTERKLLDIACGTGRHAREFCRLGYDVTGVDHSASMLEQARQQTESEGMSIPFSEQDFRQLDLEAGAFDIATCLFDSIGYVKTNDNLKKAFGSFGRVLRDEGLLFIEFWHAGAMIRDYSPERVRHYEADWGTIERTSRTTMNIAEQTCTVHYAIRELFNDGKHHGFSEEQTNRFFLVQEMDLWLRTHGFEPLSWSSEYSGKPVTEETWHVVVCARKLEVSHE